jgi:hypothetical protein
LDTKLYEGANFKSNCETNEIATEKSRATVKNENNKSIKVI